MNADAVQKKSFGRKFWTMIVIIGVLVFGGTGLWYFAAGKLGEAIVQVQQKLAARDKIIICDNQQIRGYPFRLGIFCDRIDIEDKKKQQQLKSGAIRTAAQIYDPGKLVLEFDGPAQFSDARQGIFNINWQSLRASMRANLDGIERTSAVSHAITIGHESRSKPLLNAETLEFHMRKSGENNLDFALGTRKLNLVIPTKTNDIQPQPFNLSMEMIATELFDIAQSNQNLMTHIRKNGGSGKLNALKLETTDGGILEINGPIAVDTQGLMTAKLNIKVTKLDRIIGFFSKFKPGSKDDLKKIELATKIFSAGKASAKFQIQIERGNIRLGLISLGKLPPLF